jgi:hypothetical protein
MLGEETVSNVISGLENQSYPRPNQGRLPCIAVGPLSRSVTLKGGTLGQCPPQTLATRSDHEDAEARGTAHCAADNRLLLRPSPPPCRPLHRLKISLSNPYAIAWIVDQVLIGQF